MDTDEKTASTTAPATRYVILQCDASNFWREAGPHQTARSAQQAIRQAIDQRTGTADQAGTYVAVPARSWQPVTVTVQTQTVLKLEEA